nr:MBL fold metallo-hydrolase [Bacteroidota bacterium]
MTFSIIAIVLATIVLATTLFLNSSPQFGASKKAIQTAVVMASPNYKNGKFKNLEETAMMTGFKMNTIPEYFKNGDKAPDFLIPVEKILAGQFSQLNDSLTRITWFGHSTILIEMAGKAVFIDPMLGNVPSPVSWAGSGRFNPELPIDIDSLPFIDVVLISHDHYDHLDYGSILKLKDRVGMFYAPLGVGAHLRSWGVDANKIIEMDWWESETFDGITFVSPPARHFSGRGLFDRNSTLWCSWVIQSDHANIFFSGDGGYGNHFKEIGDRFGPFDFTMMECGQYNEQWLQIHLLPDEVPQALSDLKSQVFMPVHWGAFKLSLHSWTDPIDRLQNTISGTGLKMAIPKIGEGFIMGQDIPKDKWWIKTTFHPQ